MKTSPKRPYSVIENERFGLVFAKTGSIISGTDLGAKRKPKVYIFGQRYTVTEKLKRPHYVRFGSNPPPPHGTFRALPCPSLCLCCLCVSGTQADGMGGGWEPNKATAKKSLGLFLFTIFFNPFTCHTVHIQIRTTHAMLQAESENCKQRWSCIATPLGELK